MKRIVLYLAIFLPLFSMGQNAQSIKINKLVLDSKKSFNFTEGDSSVSVIIDTLIMNDKSKLFFVGKKVVKLVVNHAVIGKNCVITGNDSKNNGADLDLAINFIQLKSLYINVAGEDAKVANRHYDNGDGGHVTLNYLSSGKKPQFSNKKLPGYIYIDNKAGGNLVNAQTDIGIIMAQVRSGARGRPLNQLPNGRVYSGNIGNDGKTTIKPVTNLLN